MPSTPSPSALPDALHAYDQWVCWRSQLRNGTQTKVPINPSTGSFASTTDRDTWSDLATAREYAVTSESAGVGFVFTADDPFVGVDLDDCRVPPTGTLHDRARAIVDRLDSYTETSPSGTGVHVLVRGSLPDGRNRHEDVELYETARFFTVTGDHRAGTPTTIEPRPDQLTAVHADFVTRAAESPDRLAESRSAGGSHNGRAAGDLGDSSATDVDTENTAANTSGADIDGVGADDTGSRVIHLDDEELLTRAKAATNGEKFTSLWNGTTTGYDSHSEADMALCSLLAFWTGGDADRVDRLFRRSGLIREKWDDQHFADGSTYGEKTIDRAIEGATAFYTPETRDPASATTNHDDERPEGDGDDRHGRGGYNEHNGHDGTDGHSSRDGRDWSGRDETLVQGDPTLAVDRRTEHEASKNDDAGEHDDAGELDDDERKRDRAGDYDGARRSDVATRAEGARCADEADGTNGRGSLDGADRVTNGANRDRPASSSGAAADNEAATNSEADSPASRGCTHAPGRTARANTSDGPVQSAETSGSRDSLPAPRPNEPSLTELRMRLDAMEQELATLERENATLRAELDAARDRRLGAGSTDDQPDEPDDTVGFLERLTRGLD